MSEKRTLRYIYGDVVTGREISYIEKYACWSSWDQMFGFYNCVFDNENFVFEFVMKYSETIVSQEILTEEQWVRFCLKRT